MTGHPAICHERPCRSWHYCLTPRLPPPRRTRPTDAKSVLCNLVLLWLCCHGFAPVEQTLSYPWTWVSGCPISCRGKVKVHTFNIAPLRSESPPQKRSEVWHVFSRDFTVLPAHRRVHLQSELSHTCLCLPSRSWYSFTDPGRMEGWVDLGVK